MSTANQSVFLGTKPKRTVVCNQSSNYAKTLKGKYSTQISKRTMVCNQSSNYATTLKVNTALQAVFFGTKPKRTMVCKKSWQELDNPRHHPSRHAAFGGILNLTTPRPRPSKHAAFGEILNWTRILWPDPLGPLTLGGEGVLPTPRSRLPWGGRGVS